MAYTEAQKKAAIKYMQEKTDDIRLRVPKGTKNLWKQAAENADKSMTVYVFDAVAAQIALDETGENEIDGKVFVNLLNWLESHGHTKAEALECLAALSGEPS